MTPLSMTFRRSILSTSAIAALLLGAASPAFADKGPKPPKPPKGDKITICHRTKGPRPYHEITVAASAVPAHLAHGDKALATWYRDADGDGHGAADQTVTGCTLPCGYTETRDDCDDTSAAIAPGLSEVCGDGVDNNCEGTVDEGCSGTCTPIDSITEEFQAPLDAKWMTGVAGASAPTVVAGQACGDDQSVAVQSCVKPASSWRISFDFTAGNTEGIEAYAILAQDIDSGNAFVLGCDGGFNNGSTSTCGLTISSFSSGTIVPRTDPHLSPGVTYTIIATGAANGDLTVEVLDHGTSLLALSGNAGAPIAVSKVGFVVGRNADSSLTCLDHFSFTSAP